MTSTTKLLDQGPENCKIFDARCDIRSTYHSECNLRLIEEGACEQPSNIFVALQSRFKCSGEDHH